MAALTLTAGAKPIFLSENRFNRHSFQNNGIVVSSGSQYAERLYDMDPEAQWSSVDSDDTIVETIEGQLWAAGAQLSYDIDFAGVYGHNAEHIKFELSPDNGVSWVTAFDLSGVTDDFSRISLSAAQAADKFRISLYTTQTANQEKLVGNIVLAANKFQSADHPISYSLEAPLIGHKTARLADNSIRRAYNFRSAANYKLHSVAAAWMATTSAERALYRDLAYGASPFIAMFEPGDEQLEVYQMSVRPGSYREDYFNIGKSGGRRIGMVFEEVGGA